MSTLQLATPGSLPAQIAYNMSRSITGQMRIDYGLTSIITNPKAAVMLLLDHVNKEFREIPTPPSVSAQLTPPGMPGIPGMPPMPAAEMAIKDLGIRIVQGIEVMGRQITLPPLAPPTPPGLPGAPAMPTPPQLPMIAETWVSTKLLVPVLTRITGSFGQVMCHCKNTVAGEPPPTAFQVPPDYKQVGLPPAPTPPAPPAMPSAPAPPSMPGMPSMPAAPSAPAAPSMPSITPPKPPTFKF